MLKIRPFQAIALLALTPPVPGQAPARLSSAQWKEDVAYFGRELAARHKNLFSHLSKEDFDQQVSQLSDAAANATDIQMRAGLARIVAAVGDIHTFFLGFNEFGPLELRFRQFPEGWYCIEARADMAEAVGAQLVSVAAVPVDEVARRLLPFVAQQNSIQTADALSNLLILPRALEAAGLPVAGGSADFEFVRNGKHFTIRASPPARPAAGEWAQRKDIRRTPPGAAFQVPLSQSDPNSKYWFRYLQPASTLYIQYNQCLEDQENPMKRFAAEVARTIAEKRPARVVVDAE